MLIPAWALSLAFILVFFRFCDLAHTVLFFVVKREIVDLMLRSPEKLQKQVTVFNCVLTLLSQSSHFLDKCLHLLLHCIHQWHSLICLFSSVMLSV